MLGRACLEHSPMIFCVRAHTAVPSRDASAVVHISFFLIESTFHVCTALCLWWHLCYRNYSTASSVAPELPCVQKCAYDYGSACVTLCPTLCLWLYLCYRVYSTASMVPPVLLYVQLCVYGDTCTTVCTALCLWWHLCYRMYSTVFMVASVLPCASHT